MRHILAGALYLMGSALWADPSFNFNYNPQTQQWDLQNGVVRAVFQLGVDSKFKLVTLEHITAERHFTPPSLKSSSPISFELGATQFNADTLFRLVDQRVENPNDHTGRQVIVLRDLGETAEIELDLEMYSGQPVLRHRVSITNLTSKKAYLRAADLVPYSFAADGQTFRMFRVAQWAVAPRSMDFQTSEDQLSPDGTPSRIQVGSGGLYCAWMALRDDTGRGLFTGWEFDGQSFGSARMQGTEDTVSLSANIRSIFHPVAARATMKLPAAFVGLFEGRWDEAGFRTQRFMETALAQPAPSNFPYVSWDSWGYDRDINEEILRRNAESAARLGVELFVVDLGWARQLGDWREDPVKFPSGLRALSDYVHSLGMKFGLHFALASVAVGTPVLEDHPDWTSTEVDQYYGAMSLCLSNKPTRDWVIQQAVQIIDNYNVDYLLQDGQNMVKLCLKKTHTHDFRDSNYSNAVDGINEVIEQIQRLRPSVIWENCENGGNMMTFNMVQHYATSITNDGSGARGSRQGVWGATYPFSPRYADRYMPEDPSSGYITRSYMFGGPWHFMNRLVDMDSGMQAFAQSEIATYKRIRGLISGGQVFHLTVEPGEGHTDALESYSATQDYAIAIVTRDNTEADMLDLKLDGLRGGQNYVIQFADDRRILTMTGTQLMTQGVRVNLPEMQSSEIVYVAPLGSLAQ